MDFIIFLIGFILGITLMFIVQKVYAKKDKEMFNQMQLQFENLSAKIFKETSQDFSEQNKEKLKEFWDRFKEKIDEFQSKTEKNFKEEVENFTRFDENIKSFIDAGTKISQDTNALVNVMRSDNRQQGKWGELVLERVFEASNLRKDEEYKIQSSSEMGRPDAIVILPENRCVFIDAKTTFASYDAYINATDETTKENYLKEFKSSVKNHISILSKKDYTADETLSSPDYVLMFIPIESAYSLLFCEDAALWDFAWKNKIMPVSPSTLLASLKIINVFHTVSRQNKNVIEITRICTKMLNKLSDMVEDIKKAKTNLNSAFTRLAGKDNIISNIEKMQELGAKIEKPIPSLPDNIENTPENVITEEI